MSKATDDFLASQPPIPLARHAAIVRDIYDDFHRTEQLLRVILGHQHPDGHRYEGERCVWCGVNYLDRLLNAPDDERCPGPAEGEWDDDWWPLEKVDALLAEHRAAASEERSAAREAAHEEAQD